MYKINNTLGIIRNQAFVSDSNKIVEVIGGLTRSEGDILNYIVNQYLYHQDFDMYESQGRIASALQVSIKTVSRAHKKLKDLGLLTSFGYISKDFNCGTLKYVPSLLLFKFKFHLYHMLPALRKVSIVTLKKLGLITNVLPYKKDLLILPRKYILQVKDRVTSTVNGVTGYFKINKKQKREIMDEAGNLKISPTLREITQRLNLSRHGQIKLLSFDDKTLSVVWNQGKVKSGVKDMFSWLMANCSSYCSMNNINIDWDIYYTLLKRYSISKDAPYVIAIPKPKSVATSPLSTFTQRIPEYKRKQIDISKLPPYLVECTKEFYKNNPDLLQDFLGGNPSNHNDQVDESI